MSTRGRSHTPGEKRLLEQVRQVFSEKKDKPGARKAAKTLNISLASFYNYARGIDLPRMEVLRDAQKKWGIKWLYLDPSELLRVKKIKTHEQLKLAFLNELTEENVQVADVESEDDNVLRLELKIRF